MRNAARSDLFAIVFICAAGVVFLMGFVKALDREAALHARQTAIIMQGDGR